MSPQMIEIIELKPFFNHIYEYSKGVRRMVLYTMNRKFEFFATQRLDQLGIEYFIQPLDESRMNLFFGKIECIQAISKIVNKPLNKLSPEEDFILGALLGYDITIQCERFYKLKS